jgi:hypothetical protein
MEIAFAAWRLVFSYALKSNFAHLFRPCGAMIQGIAM